MSRTTAGSNRRDDATQAKETGEQRVRGYDFVRPACLSKEQLRTLQLLHESFAHKLSGVLSPPLRLQVRVTPGAAREMTYADFTQGLPEFRVTATLHVSSECGAALLTTGCDTALFMIDRLLGGTESALPQPRWLTEIECTLMEGVLSRIMNAYAGTWQPLAPVSGQVRAVTSSSMFGHVALPTDIVCVAEFSLEMGSATGAVSLCLPVIACEPLLGKLDLQHWLSAGRPQDWPAQERPDKQVTQVRVPVAAILGSARLTLAQIAALKVNDVIRLDKGSRDEVEIIVGGRTKFFGRPGRTDGRLGVKITRSAAPGEGTR